MKHKKVITIPMEIFKNKKLPKDIFAKASKQAVKEIEQHFKTDDWPLDYNFYISDIFYKAMGYHLEDHLLKALAKSKVPFEIFSGPSTAHRLLIKVSNKGKK